MINTFGEMKRVSGHFFDPDTMRFFKSRVAPWVYPVADGCLFVTSERYGNGPRTYRVRLCTDDGDFTTLREFKSRNGAHKAAQRMAATMQ